MLTLRRSRRIPIVLGGIASVALTLNACGSDGSGSNAATTQRQAAAATCPDKVGSEPFNIANNLGRDLTYSASAPNCKAWGSKPPAAFNGRDIPTRASGDPEIRFWVSGVDRRNSEVPVPTRLTFTASDGSVIAAFNARFRPLNDTYQLGLDIYDEKAGDFVQDTPVTVGKTAGGTVQAVAPSKVSPTVNGPGAYRLILQWAK